jgi:putative membrane protein
MVRGTTLCGVAGLVGLIASHAFALPSSADRTFTEKAAAAGTAEIQAAQLAQQRARLNDHQQAVALFRQEASSGHDPALKAFAQKTMPILRQHLQMAQSLTASGR